MARKNVLSYQSLTDADMSGTVTSAITNVTNLDTGSYRLFWDSVDAEGEFIFEVSQSDKAEAVLLEDADFFELDFGATIGVDMTVLDPDSEHQVVFTSLQFKWLRVKYIPSAGTGTVSAKFTARQVGG